MAAGDHQGAVATFPAAKVVVVIVPFLAHGHLNQHLHLAQRIAVGIGLPVHFVGTTDHLRQVRHRHLFSTVRIHFHEFPTPPFDSPPPDPSVPFPTHLQPSFDATIHLRRPIAALLRSLSHTAKRVAVIHDTLMSYVVQDAESIPNAETFVFQTPSAFYRCCRRRESTGEPFPIDPELWNRVPSQDGIFSPEFLKFVDLQRSHLNFYVGKLYDSSRVIEGEFIKYLERKEISGGKKIWAIGPVNPIYIASIATVSENRHKCLSWLDKQPENSVIYVSFGTTTTFSDDQIRELAIGLETSEQRFIWVVRAADIGDVSGLTDRTVKLPNGFEERVKDRGFIERGWAPQLKILQHFATGGFMSHCGWNSSMESISFGVPMVTWPMHSDQPRNAFLITDILRIGVAVKDWERRKELVTAMMVEEAVKKLMCSEEGEEMRKRAAELHDEVESSMAKDGIYGKEMTSFISYICR